MASACIHFSRTLGPPSLITSVRSSRSLGITMYEIVVGRTPFEKDNSEEFLTKE